MSAKLLLVLAMALSVNPPRRGVAPTSSDAVSGVDGQAITPSSVTTSSADAGVLLGGYVAATGAVAVGTSSGGGPAVLGSIGAGIGNIWLGLAPNACTDSNYFLRGDTSGAVLYIRAANNEYHVINGSIIGTWSSTGLAVTGKVSSTTNATTCTLNGGTPSSCTATVTAGARCNCNAISTTGVDTCTLNLVTTTLTVYSTAASTNVVNIWCDK